MHELSIALSILDVAAEEAERRAVGLAAIHLKLGPFAGVIKEALLSAFDMAKEVSPFPNVQLVIEEIPVRVYCPACQAEQAPVSMYELRCSVCGGPTPDIRHGRELEVAALEVIDDVTDPVG